MSYNFLRLKIKTLVDGQGKWFNGNNLRWCTMWCFINSSAFLSSVNALHGKRAFFHRLAPAFFLAAAWIFLSGGDVIAPYLIWFLIWHFFKMHKTLPKSIRLRNYKSHFQRNGHYFAFKNVIKMVLQSQVESERRVQDRITKLNKNHIWKMFSIYYETLRGVNAKTLKIVNLISSWHVAIGQWHQILSP